MKLNLRCDRDHTPINNPELKSNGKVGKSSASDLNTSIHENKLFCCFDSDLKTGLNEQKGLNFDVEEARLGF